MSKITYRLVNSQKDIINIANNLIADSIKDSDLLSSIAVVVISGERLSVCDEAIVAYSNNEPVGMITISPMGETGQGPEFVGIFVKQNFRGKGIGKKLTIKAIERAKERGFDKVSVTVTTKLAKRLNESLSNRYKGYLKIIDASDFSPF